MLSSPISLLKDCSGIGFPSRDTFLREREGSETLETPQRPHKSEGNRGKGGYLGNLWKTEPKDIPQYKN